MFFMWFPIYWAYQNFDVWVICASVTFFIFPEVVGEFMVDVSIR